MAVGLLLAEPVGESHGNPPFCREDVLELEKDFDHFLEAMHDGNAAFGGLRFELGVAHLQQKHCFGLRRAYDLEAVQQLIVDDNVEPQSVGNFTS
jgi:hypothetical protein